MLMKLGSVEASKRFVSNSLDCVYIDANHDAEPFLADLDAWWPKVKSGGLFCGHDAYDSTEGGRYCKVGSTIKKWIYDKNIHVEITGCTSWWIRKP